jgi:hypothetical protein
MTIEHIIEYDGAPRAVTIACNSDGVHLVTVVSVTGQDMEVATLEVPIEDPLMEQVEQAAAGDEPSVLRLVANALEAGAGLTGTEVDD